MSSQSVPYREFVEEVYSSKLMVLGCSKHNSFSSLKGSYYVGYILLS